MSEPIEYVEATARVLVPVTVHTDIDSKPFADLVRQLLVKHTVEGKYEFGDPQSWPVASGQLYKGRARG